MPAFESYTPEEIDFLAGLFYRTGAWISQSDDLASTEKDDILEQKALEKIMGEIGKRYEKSPFVMALAAQALKQKDLWAGWLEDPGHLPEDLEKAETLVRRKTAKADRDVWKHAVMEVGYVTAESYGEFEHLEVGSGWDLGTLFERASLFVQTLLGNIPENSPENVSASESAALEELAECLRLYDEED